MLNVDQWCLSNTHCAPHTASGSCKQVGKKTEMSDLPSRSLPHNGQMGWKTNINGNNLNRRKESNTNDLKCLTLAGCPRVGPPGTVPERENREQDEDPDLRGGDQEISITWGFSQFLPHLWPYNSFNILLTFAVTQIQLFFKKYFKREVNITIMNVNR